MPLPCERQAAFPSKNNAKLGRDVSGFTGIRLIDFGLARVRHGSTYPVRLSQQFQKKNADGQDEQDEDPSLPPRLFRVRIRANHRGSPYLEMPRRRDARMARHYMKCERLRRGIRSTAIVRKVTKVQGQFLTEIGRK